LVPVAFSDSKLILVLNHTLRVMKNRVLRKIFGPKKEEITLGWRKMHNEQLSDLCYPPYISTVIELRMRWRDMRYV
jgi:hypothetical protein